MNEFEKNMTRFKKAFSPLYNQFVTIEKIRHDRWNEILINAKLITGETILFRKSELRNFCTE